MRHVLFLVNNFSPRVGGVETHVKLLAEELVRRGHRATVVTLGDEAERTEENGVLIMRLRRGFEFGTVMSFPRWGATRALVREFEDSDVSWVSTHTRFFPLTWMGIRLGRATGTPVVHTEHGSGFVRGVGPAVGFLSRVVDITIGRWALRASDCVLGVSEDVVGFVQKLASVEAAVFYNAIPNNLGDRNVPPLPIPRVTFVGRLVPGKGADRVLRAIATLAESHRGLVRDVQIIGDGPERERLERLSDRLGLSDVVTFTGRIEPAAVFTALAGSVFVNPTTLAEGFQTTLLEALAVGARIVTFPVPGAQLLSDQGAPVTIVESRSNEALVAAIQASVTHPLPAFDEQGLVSWRWSARASEYLELATTVIHRV